MKILIAMTTYRVISILILVTLTTSFLNAQSVMLAKHPAEKVEICILYDNYVCTPGTESDWGFSCLIEADEQQILFDAGTKPDILMKNIGITKTDISEIDQIFISHNHGDHTGGLWAILGEKSEIPVHLPHPPASGLKTRIAQLGGIASSNEKPFALTDHIWSGGTMGGMIHEQCVVIHYNKGLVVVTGCSHPGISEMLKQIKNEFGKDIYAVLGGFHLMMHSKKQIEKIIGEFRDMGIKKCGCTHCTGEKQIQQFREAFGNDFMEMGTGRRITI